MLQLSDFHWDEYWWSAKSQRVPFLTNPVTVTIYTHCERAGTDPNENVLPTDRQIEIANSLFGLNADLSNSMDDVAELARAECDEQIDLADYGLGHINRKNIGDHYRIQTIIVPGDCSPIDEYLFLDGECDWEDEHGLRLSMKNGEFTGHSCQGGGISIQDISENGAK